MGRIKRKLRDLNIRYNPWNYAFAPEWLVLGVNNLCNLHCKMCDVGTKYDESNFYQNLMGTDPVNMPLELCHKIFDQAAEYYPSAKIGFAFTEPLIYPHLVEAVSYANRRNLYTSVTTNALALPKIASQLAEAGLDELMISLDGLEDTHNEIRGHKHSFQRAIEGIKRIREESPTTNVSVFCVITEWNIGQLKQFADYFRHIPLKQLGFMHTNFTPDDVVDAHNQLYGEKYPATVSNLEGIDLARMDLEKLQKEITEIKADSYPFTVSFSPDVDTLDGLIEFYYNPAKIIGRRCNDIFSNIMIKSDGSVIPAHGRCYNLTLGNINESNLYEIWNSSRLASFRSTVMQAGGLLPACSRCCSGFSQ